MPDSPDWYEVTQGRELLQGGLLCACPIPRVRGLGQRAAVDRGRGQGRRGRLCT